MLCWGDDNSLKNIWWFLRWNPQRNFAPVTKSFIQGELKHEDMLKFVSSKFLLSFFCFVVFMFYVNCKTFVLSFRYFLDSNLKKTFGHYSFCFFSFFLFFLIFCNLKQYSIKESMWNYEKYYLGVLNQ